MEFKWMVIGMIGMLLIVMLSLGVQNYTQSQDMKACVAAGKSWEHVRGDIYECK